MSKDRKLGRIKLWPIIRGTKDEVDLGALDNLRRQGNPYVPSEGTPIPLPSRRDHGTGALESLRELKNEALRRVLGLDPKNPSGNK